MLTLLALAIATQFAEADSPQRPVLNNVKLDDKSVKALADIYNIHAIAESGQKILVFVAFKKALEPFRPKGKPIKTTPEEIAEASKDLALDFVKNDWDKLAKLQGSMIDLKIIELRKVVSICQVRQTNSQGDLRKFWREMLAHYRTALDKLP